MRVVLTTFGSLGDLHPYLAVGKGLRARGHEVVVATSEIYRERVVADGLEFCPVRPDLGPLRGDLEVLKRLWHPRKGTEYLMRTMVMPFVEESYEDLTVACLGADVIVTHLLSYAAPVVAEVMGIPAVAVGLQPSAFISAYDPPVLAQARWLYGLRHLGPMPYRVLFALGSLRVRGWTRPLRELRARLGLAEQKGDPVLKWAWQTGGAMAWFPAVFGAPQRDWPTGTVVTGFPFYDSAAVGLSAGTEEFLVAGEAPVVFTLGSAAVSQAGDFYAESARGAGLAGMRAVLLVGEDAGPEVWGLASETVHVSSYEPYAALFPRAVAVVHQCGIGTTGESLRAGVPVVAVPWGYDQFDNAERLKRMGCGVVMERGRYRAEGVARELRRVGRLRERCGEVARMVRSEDGVEAACGAIERVARGA